MKDKYIVPSYWALFVVMPALIVGALILCLSLPKWIFVMTFVSLILFGERGVKIWESYLEDK